MARKRAPPTNVPDLFPTAGATIELCNSFAEYAEAGAYNRALLIDAGRHAVQRYPDQVDVLVAVGRMYLAADELAPAQAILEQAARRAPQDGRVVRLLAGALLRLGDARGAEELVEAAIARGVSEREMRSFRASMKEFADAQRVHGKEAVPRELKRRLARAASASVASAVQPKLLGPPPEWEGTAEEWNALLEVPPYGGPREPGSKFRYVRRKPSESVPPAPRAAEAPDPGRTVVPASIDLTSASPAGTLDPSAGADAARRRKRRRWAVVAGASLLLVAGPTALGLHQRAEAREHLAKELCRQAAGVLAAGGRGSSAQVDEALAQAIELAPKSAEAATCLTRVRAMQALEQDPRVGPKVASMLENADKTGASPAEFAYIDVAAAVTAREAKRAESLVARYDKDPSRRMHPVYELSAGAALELVADPRAIDRYKAALGIEPGLFAVEVRVVRALLLDGSFAQGRSRAQALSQAVGDRPEVRVLDALARALEPVRTDARDAALPEPEDLPVPLRSIARALRAAASPDAATRVRELTAAVAEADSPSAAVFCGGVALDVAEAATAREAVRRALETAPVYAPALLLGARIALLEGRTEEAERSLSGLDAPGAAELRALVDYETGSYDDLAATADRVRDAATRDAMVAIAARDRVRGDVAPTAERMDQLARSCVWGALVALDMALDVGDLARARALLQAQPWIEKSPSGALRAARLLRYERSFDAARKALAGAAQTHAALVERALLEAEGDGAKAYAASLGERLEPERRWLESYLVARGGGASPRPLIAALAPPAAATPLPLRFVAALALGEAGDRARGATLVRTLLPTYGANPDVARAAAKAGVESSGGRAAR
jgi:tetratricopeptide (TPR) repeat protein